MKPFRPDDSFQKSRGNLPHWTQDGVIYFITFRLADSIPKTAMDEWSGRRSEWLMSRGMTPQAFDFEKLSENERKEYRRRFGQKFHEMLDDCLGDCLLRKSANAKMVADAMEFFEGERYWLGDYVVMPNHVHLLISPYADFKLKKIMQSLKSHTAKKINKLQGKSGQLWQRESYDHIVRSENQLLFYEQYIQENSDKAKLREGEYLLRERK